MSKHRVPYCPLNGGHGRINGASTSFPVDPCNYCGQDGLTNYNHYCPTCFKCRTCERVIKRKYINF